MPFIRKPWSNYEASETFCFLDEDSLLAVDEGDENLGGESITLNESNQKSLKLYPYPKRGNSDSPPIKDFPIRLKVGGRDPETAEEKKSAKLTHEMNAMIARVQELDEALDDPTNVWRNLRKAWKRAEKEDDPRMAEIVRQAVDLLPVLKILEKKIRRVLRRTRQQVPLDRTQEMDRGSMVWLSKQPGSNVEERAGSNQRILAVVREENFNTLENKVVLSYSILVEKIARDWLRENKTAENTKKFADVDKFKRHCRNLSRKLRELGIGEATVGIIPNYVLTENIEYKKIYDGWLKLLNRENLMDDLWAWQSETWTDFCVLATILSIDSLDEAQLVSQAPILFRSEARNGRWFEQEQPIAVFWLRHSGTIIEVQSRPKRPGTAMLHARAYVALRTYSLGQNDFAKRILIWTPHNLGGANLSKSAEDACQRIIQIRGQNEIIKNGIIITPAHGDFQKYQYSQGSHSIEAISFDAFGASLENGIKQLSSILQSDYLGGRND